MATNSLTLTWVAPTSGTPPITFQPQYRVHGASSWITFGPAINALTVTVTGLQPGTTYDFEIVAINSGGSTASTVATGTTTSVGGTVPSIPANVVVSP